MTTAVEIFSVFLIVGGIFTLRMRAGLTVGVSGAVLLGLALAGAFQ